MATSNRPRRNLVPIKFLVDEDELAELQARAHAYAPELNLTTHAFAKMMALKAPVPEHAPASKKKSA